MAKPTFTQPEIEAMLEVEGISKPHIDALTKRMEFVASKRQSHGQDEHWEVGSGYNHAKDRGHVRLKAGALEHQLEPKKAVQIGLWLIEAAEAAIADTTVMTWLKTKVGLTDHERLGQMLLDLREIRQGSREAVYRQ